MSDNSTTAEAAAPLTRGGRDRTICDVPTLGRSLAISFFLLLLTAGHLRAEDAAGSSTRPVDVVVEVLEVGESGTETLATDQARVFLGKGALLAREVTLEGAHALKGSSEKLRLRAELRMAGVTQAGLAVSLKSKVAVLAMSGGGQIPRGDITRNVALQIGAGASELVTVYESDLLQKKVVLHIRWSDVDASSPSPADPTPVEFSARIYEVAESGETLLADNHLMSLVGHSASTTFDRVVPLAGQSEKRARQDRMEITITSQTLSGGSLSLMLEVSGEVITLTPADNFTHPLAHQGSYLLSSGEPAGAEIEISSDSEAKEGWSKIKFRIQIAAHF